MSRLYLITKTSPGIDLYLVQAAFFSAFFCCMLIKEVDDDGVQQVYVCVCAYLVHIKYRGNYFSGRSCPFYAGGQRRHPEAPLSLARNPPEAKNKFN